MFLKQETKQKLLEKTGSIRLYVIASLAMQKSDFGARGERAVLEY